MTSGRINPVYYWLIICNVSIFLMVIIGAITRLTESGLSMVEWKPLIGALPPLNDQEWQRVFDLYKQTPEFQKKNFWMEMNDFQSIFFWEWLHRLWGRMIGMIYALPFLFFMIKGWIPKGYRLKLLGLLILGGLQGYMGWYMVQSGLVNQPAVSHYRLAAHLSLAFLIYVFILWNILDFRRQMKSMQAFPDARLYSLLWICLGFVILTIFWGAYTAGLDAGLVYNDTFPKMGPDWVPAEIWITKPYWVNLFENHAGVQFVHRWLAMTTAMMIAGVSVYSISRGRRETVFPALICMVILQLTLGIITLLSSVNIVVAVAHQGGALVLLSLVVVALYITRPVGDVSKNAVRRAS